MIKKYILAIVLLVSFTGCDEVFNAIDKTKSDAVKEGLVSVKYFAFKDSQDSALLPLSCMKFEENDIINIVKKDANGENFNIVFNYSIANNEVNVIDQSGEKVIFHINQNNIGDDVFTSTSNPNYSITKNPDCLDTLITDSSAQ